MRQYLLVFLGGGLGSIARFLIGKFYSYWQLSFPLATLTANFLSCLIFGAVLMFSVEKSNLDDLLKLLLITGFCGGFSTFSAFTFETVELFKNGQSNLAIANITLNLILSICGLLIGTSLMKLAL